MHMQHHSISVRPEKKFQTTALESKALARDALMMLSDEGGMQQMHSRQVAI